ncbi:hypothetical protein QBC36DRAFT_50212 [Triangularia setosa]|uniref:BHLH domain-containing protein n=1 Tax=Triangularia setosa TaxID=2587417 RepID=A0AAN7A5E8_9PEZI|nr:hypothetical protein QBC36DRAFT_50212 [Podospora setosa]
MATINPNVWGTDPERGPALTMMEAHGLSTRCPTTAPNVDVYFSSGYVGADTGWGLAPAPAQIPSFSCPHPHPHTAPFGFHYVPDDPGRFAAQHHPTFQPPGITNHPSCPTTTTTTGPTGQIGNNSSGKGYFAHHNLVAPVTWAAETATVTSISERSLFSFEHQLHPCDTTIRTTDPSSFSPVSTHSPLHSPTFTPSSGGRNVSWSASSCASSPPPSCEKSGDDYFASSSTTTIVLMDANDKSSIQQPPLKPGSRVIAASPLTTQSQAQTLEEYESNRRMWHNQIGKKYRTKLNEQFENLQLVLRLYDEDDEDTDTEGANISIKGRSINKAKLLDMARQKLEELMNERKAWRQEKRELMENLGMSEE